MWCFDNCNQLMVYWMTIHLQHICDFTRNQRQSKETGAGQALPLKQLPFWGRMDSWHTHRCYFITLSSFKRFFCVMVYFWEVLPQGIRIQNNLIVRKPKANYLGLINNEDMSDDADVFRQVKCLYIRGNIISRKFANCSINVKLVVFKTYCSCLYTSQLWGTCLSRTVHHLEQWTGLKLLIMTRWEWF